MRGVQFVDVAYDVDYDTDIPGQLLYIFPEDNTVG